MRVLLLGGNGFVGSHVKDALLVAGHSVRVLDRAPERFRAEPPDAEHVLGDVGNAALLDEATAGVEAVVHLAWTTVPKTAEDDPAFDVESNLVLTTHVLAAAARHGVAQLVFLSSGGTVYGPTPPSAVPETHPTEPIGSYGATKLAAERYVRLHARRHGFRATILRPSNPYGPRQDPRVAQGAVSVFLHRILRDEPLVVWGHGDVVRDYVYVGDLAAATVAALAPRPDTTADTYNVGSGRGVSLLELVHTLEAVTARTARLRFEPARPVDVPWNVLDVARAKAELGWEPRVDLTAGLGTTTRWIRETLPGATDAAPDAS